MTAPTTDVRPAGAPGSRRLSVAELQDALRRARANELADDRPVVCGDRDVPPLRPASATSMPPAAQPAAAWVVVLAAHGGAGASTTALALAEALAVTRPGVQLIETVTPWLSGLVAAASTELGVDDTGQWRRGTRDGLTLTRLAGDVPEHLAWPSDPAGGTAPCNVVDLGVVRTDDYLNSTSDDAFSRAPVVVVCRATVPGVRHAERALARLGRPAVLAAIGDARWPGEVKTSAGPLVTAARAAGRFVAIPVDRHLEVTGLHPPALPKSVAAAGRSLFALLDIATSGGVTTTAATGRNVEESLSC